MSAPGGLHAEFVQALKAAGAVYCATCREYLYPDHRHAATAPARPAEDRDHGHPVERQDASPPEPSRYAHGDPMGAIEARIVSGKILERYFPRCAPDARPPYEDALVDTMLADGLCACLDPQEWDEIVHEVTTRVELTKDPDLIDPFTAKLDDIRHVHAHRRATVRACRQLGCDDRCSAAEYRDSVLPDRGAP
jgi:hypothetical protein